MKEVFIIITIKSNRIDVPLEDFYIGCAGDNLRSTRQFMLENSVHTNCTHRLYLTFLDGTTNHLVLDSEVTNDSTVLRWTISKEHIFKSGLITAQIKTFCEDDSVIHTPQFYLYAYDSTEYSEGFANENSEFLEYESKLNSLLNELEKMNLASFVKNDRKVAGCTLSTDITVDMLLNSLKTYPVRIFTKAPTKDTIGKVNQLGAYINYDPVAKTYSADLYLCCGITAEGGCNWAFVNSTAISDEKISSSIAQYLKEHPLDSTGADGKSAYEVAVDNGFEGTEQEWLLSLKGENGANGLDGKDGEDGFSPIIRISSTDTGYTLSITHTENFVENVPIKHGTNGKDGEKGADGKDGQDGKTPVLGVDYFTEEDKTQIVQSVIDSLGATPVFGYVDENNNVIVRGLLSDGTYNIKYELEDGTTIDIGELTLGGSEEPEINNLFNAETASLNCRIGSSGSLSAYNGMVTTDYIPVDSTMNGKNFVISGLTPVKSSAYNYYVRIGFYDENQAVISNTLMSYSEGYAGTVTAWDSDITSNNAYIRISIVVKDNVALTSDDIADLIITLE